MLRYLTAGESHGQALVVVVEGLPAGLPVTVAGATINRFCSSGLQAVALAAHQIINEGAEAMLHFSMELTNSISVGSISPFHLNQI